MTGEWPEEIDHENHLGYDNRWINLKEVDHKNNSKNNSLQSNNKSGYSGISFDNKTNKWWARINSKPNTRISLGYFKDIEDAAKARKEAEIKYGYHENHGR